MNKAEILTMRAEGLLTALDSGGEESPERIRARRKLRSEIDEIRLRCSNPANAAEIGLARKRSMPDMEKDLDHYAVKVREFTKPDFDEP